ncbi:hypothetical protein KP509_19G039500 [Ceratopteris richardii]|uniref:Hydrophobic seed protein domain-containing protein n=1 Tax=Ceratopteris richardii TaxID=49495 RepID=A0A8T2SLP6_CERRI|nr:hypothetical protein KP509_19G039500 [Ceratopteris richardii]
MATWNLHGAGVVVIALTTFIMSGFACPSCDQAPSREQPGSAAASTPVNGSGGAASCPIDINKLEVCSSLLTGLVTSPLQSNCCALLGTVGLDVDLCLCAAIDANVLGLIDVRIPRLYIIAKIVTACGQSVQGNFSCPP